MRVGVVMLPTDPWPEARERARRVEALGYDHLWTYDHASWRRYRGRAWFSALPWLTGMAGATERIRLGTMVTTPNLRHPVTLAQDAVTLDHVSGGRFVLGIGAGGPGFDSTVLGGERLSNGALVERLDEFAGLLGRLFREDTVSHSGAYYKVDEAVIRPAALQSPRIPIALAAAGPKAIALVARHADAWITFGAGTSGDARVEDPLDAVRAQIRTLDEACSAVGRDARSVQRIYMTDNSRDRPLASAAAFDEFVDRYAELGFTDIVFHHPRRDDPVWDEPESILDEIATDVLPRWR